MDSVQSYPFLFWPVWLWGIFTFCQQLKISVSSELAVVEYLFGWKFPILREDAALLTTLIYWVCCMYVSMYLLPSTARLINPQLCQDHFTTVHSKDFCLLLEDPSRGPGYYFIMTSKSFISFWLLSRLSQITCLGPSS